MSDDGDGANSAGRQVQELVAQTQELVAQARELIAQGRRIAAEVRDQGGRPDAVRIWFAGVAEDEEDAEYARRARVTGLQSRVRYGIDARALPPTARPLLLVLETGVRIAAARYYRIIPPEDGEGVTRFIRCDHHESDVVRYLVRSDPDMAARTVVTRLKPAIRYEIACDYDADAVTAKLVVPPMVRIDKLYEYVTRRVDV